ncbi:MAG TPA: hypothetical protein VGH33_16180 [Isosphaeraceae bacterium]|jgi:hypothetical protein
MTIDDFLRVAWWAQREGRAALREAMLTLAVAEGTPGEGWAERCRARLLAELPGHFLGTHSSLEQTLADPRVVQAIGKLRGQYPPGRVGWLRFRSEVAEGPYTGEYASLAAIIDSLAGRAAEADVRRDAPEVVRGPFARSRVEVAVGVTPTGPMRGAFLDADVSASADGAVTAGDEDESSGLYLAVLLAIAILLASVEQGRLTRAA